jgi:hypothetical protein
MYTEYVSADTGSNATARQVSTLLFVFIVRIVKVLNRCSHQKEKW